MLGDTSLILEIERDLTVYGDELTTGIGQSVREGMGQAVSARNDIALDTILTNLVIVDSVSGVIKADLGIRDGIIQGVGKGGNPHTMDITPDMAIGVGTDVISCQGLLATAGAVDLGVCFGQSWRAITAAIGSGVTSMFGGGTGSNESSASGGTPGPNHIKYMIQSTDEMPINLGFYAKANSSATKLADSFDFPKELEDQLIAGAMGLRLSECWGASPAAVDSCLRVADFHDVSVSFFSSFFNPSCASMESKMSPDFFLHFLMPI